MSLAHVCDQSCHCFPNSLKSVLKTSKGKFRLECDILKLIQVDHSDCLSRFTSFQPNADTLCTQNKGDF